MTVKVKPATRRTIVFSAAALASLPLLAPKEAKAGIITQANAKYQNQPKGAAHCAICSYFLPGPKPGANGTCKQVAGVISPNGWCQFYAKKPGS
jgi:hypothetical protein